MKRTAKIHMITAMLLGLATAATPAFGGWRVGNGGDALRLAFAKAREHAAFVTLRLQERSLPASLDGQTKKWMVENSQDLSAAIASLKHEWVLDEEPTCAWFDPTTPEKLWFSYPTCRKAIGSFDEAGQLLVHEAVHKMGIGDEDFADSVALAVYSAWRNGATDWLELATGPGAPGDRFLHAAVWTGTEMFVQGGLRDGAIQTNEGHVFDPATQRWEAISTNGAPNRYRHTAVWDEERKQVIVWGGFVARNGSKVWQNSGAIWDVETNTWQALRTPYGPAELNDLAIETRGVQAVEWTGTELIVYGGAPVNGVNPGGIYNPKTRKWRDIPTSGAPVRIYGHSMSWADDRVIVWGGVDQARNRTSTGASYFPATRKWVQMATTDAPKARDGHVAAYTGNELIVFGGYTTAAEVLGTGGVYDLVANTWKPIRTEVVPGRQGHAAVWTGSELLVHGGRSTGPITLLGAVAAYNPSSATWRVVEAPSAPAPRYLHTAVWTGTSMLMFGGMGAGTALDGGGSFFP